MRWPWSESSQEQAEILTEIKRLSREVAALRGERDAASEVLAAQRSINDLRKEITTLEIQRDKKIESHEREKRELQHMIGLEKRRQQFEIDQAKRETTVAVREENLKEDRRRFTEQMKFMGDRFAGEVGYLKDLMAQILGRLPNVEVALNRGGKSQ